MDYTPMLTMPAAISFLTWCGRGNPEQVYKRNHRLVHWAANMLSYILDTKALFPRCGTAQNSKTNAFRSGKFSYSSTADVAKW
mmetsp:Transcript_26449/g.103054  ORF Transcript_26449/g.103054 Transcript_26449/m.103054 type:complete len:83 (-) Transcript_26449:980-1228(-)